MQIGKSKTGNLTGYTANGSRSSRAEGRKPDSSFARSFTALTEEQVSNPDIGQNAQGGAGHCWGHSRVIPDACEKISVEQPKDGEQETDPLQYIRSYMAEIFKKVQNNDCEPTFQIGTQSFTEKEWEKFLKRFDSVEEAIIAAMREAHGEEMKDTESTGIADPPADEWEEEDTIEGMAMAALCSETTRCSYPAAGSETEETFYITWYTEEGIFCREQEQTEGYLWFVLFTEDGQYDRVMEFLKKFERDGNLRFASHENFWQDYLAGKINEEAFLKFFEAAENGIPDYTIQTGDATYIDREKIKYAPYMNSHGNRFYTGEEMSKMQEEMLQRNRRYLRTAENS